MSGGGEQEFVVEKIIGMRMVDGKVFYHVKWKDYPSSENTWEPKEHLGGCMRLVAQYHKEHRLEEKSPSPKRQTKQKLVWKPESPRKRKSPSPRRKSRSPQHKTSKKAVFSPTIRKVPQKMDQDGKDCVDVALNAALQSYSQQEKGVLKSRVQSPPLDQDNFMRSSSESSESTAEDEEFTSLDDSVSEASVSLFESLQRRCSAYNISVHEVVTGIRNITRYSMDELLLNGPISIKDSKARKQVLDNPMLSEELKKTYETLWSLCDVNVELFQDVLNMVRDD